MKKTLILALAALSLVGCNRYHGEPTVLLDDIKVNYEVVEDLPILNNSDAVYVFEEDKIYLKEGKFNGYLVLHELIHKIRANDGRFGDPMIEEYIAVYAAYEISKKARIRTGVLRFELPSLVKKTLEANGIEAREITGEEQFFIKKEVDHTIERFIEVLKSHGRGLNEIDWVKTAILILI